MGGIVSFFESEKQENLPLIRLISLVNFKSAGSFPRYPTDHSLTCQLDSIDIDENLIVYISHHWLRSEKKDNGYASNSHPDNAQNDKYKQCVSGIQYIFDDFVDKTLIKGCFIWVDYSCIDQDLHDLISNDYKNIPEIIRISDCLFTPIVDAHTPSSCHNLNISKEGGYMKDYKVMDWTGSEYSNRGYLKRAWCLLEMFYAVSQAKSSYHNYYWIITLTNYTNLSFHL
jgi:hypothetical protein